MNSPLSSGLTLFDDDSAADAWDMAREQRSGHVKAASFTSHEAG